MRKWFVKMRQVIQAKGKLSKSHEKVGKEESVATSVEPELEQKGKAEPRLHTLRVSKSSIRRGGLQVDVRNERTVAPQTTEQYKEAVEECNRALRDWRIAQRKLDWALEADEIDYAIYSLIAAEKHYASTLKETKRIYHAMKSATEQM